MEPKIVTRKPFHVIGFQVEANLKEIEEGNLCGKATERLQLNSDNIPNKHGNHMYLIQVYPKKENFNAFEDRFTQIIGYEVSEVGNVPDDMVTYGVPENSYVTYTHKGLESDLYKTYDYLYRKWMVENNYNPMYYDFELWDERYKPEELTNEIDLFIPIKNNL